MSETLPSRRGPATLGDVARAAGVSLATASRALNGSSRTVADSYRLRVEDAAGRLGYTANISAQATARGSSTIVALVVGDMADPYFGQIAAGVTRGADQAGLTVTIAATGGDPTREASLVRTLRGQRPRAVIMAASRVAGPDSKRLRAEVDAVTAAGGRVVTVGPPIAGARSIPVDNRGGAFSLGVRMAGLGYRRSVIVGAGRGVRTSDDRSAGFTAGFARGGGNVAGTFNGDFTRDAGYRWGEELLDRGLAPGALVFGVSDVVAVGILSAIIDAGREVGPDIAVAGFDDISTLRDVRPALTTVHLPLEDIGAAALRAALDTADDPPLWPTPEVVVRASTPGRTHP